MDVSAILFVVQSLAQTVIAVGVVAVAVRLGR